MLENASHPEFTRKAYRDFFRKPTFILVDESLLKITTELVPQGIATLVLTHDQHVMTLAEYQDGDDIKPELRVEFNPVGLMALWVTEKTQNSGQALLEWFHKANADVVPPILLVDPTSIDAVKATLLETIPTLLKRLQHAAIRLGNRDQQIVHLRRRTEGLMAHLSQAQQKLEGMGFDRRSLVLDMSPGNHTIGPSGSLQSYSLSQKLPIDSAFLFSVNLFVKTGAEVTSGRVRIRLARDADGLLFIDRIYDYSDLQDGWLEIATDRATAAEPGEATLLVDWYGADDHGIDDHGAPSFVLAADPVEKELYASERAIEEGDSPSSHSLTLQLYRCVEAEEPGLADSYQYLKSVRERAISLAETAFTYAFNEEVQAKAVAELGGQPLSRDDTDGYWQTHPVEGQWVGFRMPNALSRFDNRVRFAVETEHEMGPETRYRLLVVKAGAELGADGRTINPSDMLGEKEVAIPPLVSMDLEIDCESAIDERADIIGLVRLEASSKSFGWCRWRGLSIGRQVTTNTLGGNTTALQNPLERFYLRSYRFPDLVRSLEYLDGSAALEADTASEGFSPMMVMEDGSYMQTHPLLHRLSGAILHTGSPVDASRLITDVRTAHHGTPKMLYVMAAIEIDGLNRDTLHDEILKVLTDQASDVPEEGAEIDLLSDTLKGRAIAQPVSALQKARLELDVSELGAAHTLFAVMPLEGAINFGWCRWYSYHVETRVEAGK